MSSKKSWEDGGVVVRCDGGDHSRGNWYRQFRAMMRLCFQIRNSKLQATFNSFSKRVYSFSPCMEKEKWSAWSGWNKCICLFWPWWKVYPWKGRLGSTALQLLGQFVWLTVQRFGFVFCIGLRLSASLWRRFTPLYNCAADNVVNGLGQEQNGAVPSLPGCSNCSWLCWYPHETDIALEGWSCVSGQREPASSAPASHYLCGSSVIKKDN